MTERGTTFVSLRMRDDLVKQLDELKWTRRTDRSKEITRACEFLVTAKECPKCGALNPGNGVICSVCKQPLNEKEADLAVLRALIDSYSEEAEKIIAERNHAFTAVNPAACTGSTAAKK